METIKLLGNLRNADSEVCSVLMAIADENAQNGLTNSLSLARYSLID